MFNGQKDILQVAGIRSGHKHGIDLWALAAEFARRSPDADMRAVLKLVRADELADR